VTAFYKAFYKGLRGLATLEIAPQKRRNKWRS